MMVPRRPHRLAVLLDGVLAGWLTQDPQERFVYDPGYLATSTATPLSVSMPLTASAYRQGRVRPWIDGLLPDSDDVRRRWAGGFGVSATNPFLLLAHMGQECPGAVQLCLPDEVEGVLAQQGEYLAVDESDIAARLARLRVDSSDWTVSGERWSLGGAQSKFALAWVDGRWREALGGKPTTHIVKPGAQGYLGHGLNEHLTMATASRLGLRTAASSYQKFGGLGAVIVARYDRLGTPAGTVRVHQEDLCQALGVARGRKYEDAGGPGAASISDLLWEVSGEADVWRFNESLIFNYLVGGSDAHAKNFSLLLSGSQVRLAPLYDLSSALLYDPRGDDSSLHNLAMAVGGERRLGRLGEDNWVRLARRGRLDPARVIDRVRSLAADLPDALASVIAETGAADRQTPARYHARLVDHLRSGGLMAGPTMSTGGA
jgi:serine/threonine-protein kinase HipA